MTGKKKSFAEFDFVKQIEVLERALSEEKERILADLSKSPSLRKYTLDDISQVINDLYKLSIVREMYHKAQRRERYYGIDRRFK